MRVRRLKVLAYRSVKGYFDDGCGQRAAAISYYVLFSLFPLVIFSVGILGLLLKDEQLQTEIVDAIMETIPLSQDQGRNDVTNALQEVAKTQTSAIGFIGLIALAWSGSAMFGVVRSSLNDVYHVRSRPLVTQKLLDLAWVLAFAPFFLASVFATGALRVVRSKSEDLAIVGDIADSLGAGWWVASTLLPIILSFVAFFLAYWLIPARRIRPKYIVPGALFAAVLFEAVKIGFNVYIEHFTEYNLIFGSLGAVIAFLFWVYLSANILLLGAEVVSEMPDVMAGHFDAPQPSNKPRRSFGQKVLRLLRSLVIRQRDEEPSSQALSGPPNDQRQDAPR
jgi:membrane protein